MSSVPQGRNGIFFMHRDEELRVFAGEVEVKHIFLPSKDIFKAEDLATWETGAKAAAPTREAIVRIALNISVNFGIKRN